KRAYEAAIGGGTVGPLTNHLFTAALATGKRVRTETAIGERQLSLPAVAVALARERLGSLDGRVVVIVGTGETGELTARALADSGGRTVFVASRRRDRAISLARRYGGDSVMFDELPRVLERADMLVAATASPHLLLEAPELAEVMRLRHGRPLLMIDLAVPRDIDAMARAIVNRLLHAPTARLKELRDDRVHARMAMIRDLFGLSVDEAADVSSVVEEAAASEELAEGRELPRRRR